MKLSILHEQLQPDTNDEHFKLSVDINNKIIFKLNTAIRTLDYDPELVRNILIDVGKMVTDLPYGPMDQDEERKIRNEMLQSINLAWKDPTQENMFKFLSEWGDFWEIMIC